MDGAVRKVRRGGRRGDLRPVRDAVRARRVPRGGPARGRLARTTSGARTCASSWPRGSRVIGRRDLRDAYLAAEASAVVEVDGERIPYRRMPVRIRREPDRSVRVTLDKARLKVVEKELNPISLETTLRKHEVAQELLDTDYDDYCERLAGIDFDALEATHLGAPRGDRRSVRRPARATSAAARSPASICARCGPTIWRGCSTARSSRRSFRARPWYPASSAWSPRWVST